MIRKLLISRHYAESFITYALSVKADVRSVCSELRDFCNFLQDHSFIKLNILFMNRAMPIFIKIKAWNSISSLFKLSSITKALIYVVIKNGRSELIRDLLESLEFLLLKRNGYTKVNITLSDTSDNDALEFLKKEIASVVQFEPVFTFQEDKNILGGSIVTWDSNIIDASLRGKLGRLLTFVTDVKSQG